MDSAPMLFEELCLLCEKLEGMSGKNAMVALVSDFIKRLNGDELEPAVRFIVGEVLPPWSGKELGVGYKTVYKVVSDIVGASGDEWLRLFNACGDFGATVQALFERRRRAQRLVTKRLTIREVYERLLRVCDASGEGSRKRKERLVASLFSDASPLEAKYLAKVILGERRHGFGEALMEEAIAKAFGVPLRLVHRVSMLTSDIGLTARIARMGRRALEEQGVVLFHPVRPMLAERASSLREALREVGEAIIDWKLDGARVQIHKRGRVVRVFSRRLSDVTQSLPEVVEAVLGGLSAEEAVVEGEVVAVGEDGGPMPFQYLMRRFRRVHGVRESREDVPVKLYLFDALYLDGELLIDRPLEERRELLVGRADEELIVESIRTSDLREAERFFKRAIEEGHEGVVVKDPRAPYTPGVRGRRWLKVKAAPHTLDLVIVAAEYGHGYRYKYLSDYHLAAYDPETGRFLVVGKCFTGLTDDELEMMTRRLKELAVKQVGRVVYVVPKVVVEVGFAEIQESPHYPSGFALRFPRILRIREDKSPQDADTIETVRRVFEEQRARQRISSGGSH